MSMILKISDEQADEIIIAGLRRGQLVIRSRKFRRLVPDWKELVKAFDLLLDYYGGHSQGK